MNLSEPLMTIFGTLESGALRALSRTDLPMSGRQVASIVGSGTPSNVRLALLRLVDAGLVVARTTPAATLYTANRKHILWSVVESCLAAREVLLQRIRKLARHGPDGTAVWLYGSVARSDSTASSDVDVFVVYPNGRQQVLRDNLEHALRTDIELWTGNRVEIVSMENRDFIALRLGNDPLVRSLEEDSVVAFGPTAREIGVSVL